MSVAGLRSSRAAADVGAIAFAVRLGAVATRHKENRDRDQQHKWQNLQLNWQGIGRKTFRIKLRLGAPKQHD